MPLFTMPYEGQPGNKAAGTPQAGGSPFLTTLGSILQSNPMSGLLIGGLQSMFNRMRTNRENRYNSPIMQVSRLREAGLSPALMYGGSGAITNSVGEEKAGISESMAQYVSTLQAQKQLKLLDAQIETQEAEARNRRADADLKEDYAEYYLGEARGILNAEQKGSTYATEIGPLGYSRQQRNLRLDDDVREINRNITKSLSTIRSFEAQFSAEQIETRIENMIMDKAIKEIGLERARMLFKEQKWMHDMVMKAKESITKDSSETRDIILGAALMFLNKARHAAQTTDKY